MLERTRRGEANPPYHPRFTTAGKSAGPACIGRQRFEQVRLFEVEGRSGPLGLVVMNRGNRSNVSDSLGWPPKPPLNIEGMAFDLLRDVSNVGPHPKRNALGYTCPLTCQTDVATEYNDWYDREHLRDWYAFRGWFEHAATSLATRTLATYTAYDLGRSRRFFQPQAGWKARKGRLGRKRCEIFQPIPGVLLLDCVVDEGTGEALERVQAPFLPSEPCAYCGLT